MKEFPFDPYDFFGYIASGLLIVIGLEILIGVPQVLGKDLKSFDLIALGLGVYIAGQLVATPSKWFLENVIVRQLLKTPSINLMASKDDKPFLHYIFPGYYEPLPSQVQQQIIKKAKNENLEDPQGETLFLHIRFRDYLRNDNNLMTRLQSFLNKYGFNRNLCLVCFIFGISILLFKDFNMSSKETRYALLALITGILLFYRYIKFFRQYSYELFNSYAGTKE